MFKVIYTKAVQYIVSLALERYTKTGEGNWASGLKGAFLLYAFISFYHM